MVHRQSAKSAHRHLSIPTISLLLFSMETIEQLCKLHPHRSSNSGVTLLCKLRGELGQALRPFRSMTTSRRLLPGEPGHSSYHRWSCLERRSAGFNCRRPTRGPSDYRCKLDYSVQHVSATNWNRRGSSNLKLDKASVRRISADVSLSTCISCLWRGRNTSTE